MYLDEAVVEEHADEAGADAGVGAHGLLHLGPHEASALGHVFL